MVDFTILIGWVLCLLFLVLSYLVRWAWATKVTPGATGGAKGGGDEEDETPLDHDEQGDTGAADEERDNENLELNEGSNDEGHNPDQANGGGGGDETPITQEGGRVPPGITPIL